MKEQTERGLTEIVDILDESDVFTDEEIRLIEEYFAGGGDEILEKLEYREISCISEELQEELLWLIRNGMDEEARKAGNVYFAAGELNASDCFPPEIFSEKYNGLVSEPAGRTALFASYICVSEQRMRKPNLKKLMDYAQNNPEIIRKAFHYKGKSTSEGIILLAMYFLLKYPDIKPEDGVDNLSEYLERQGITGREAEQELDLMKQYEDLQLSIFSEIYNSKLPENVTDEIKKAIREDRVDERILKMAAAQAPGYIGNNYLNQYRKCQVGGMAYINSPLSKRLKNIASVCFAARANEMLYAIDKMDMRDDFRNRGGSFDLIFGVDSYWLIRCAALMKKEGILREQFVRNREIYLKCMDDLNFMLYHDMSEVIRQEDPEFHRAREQEEIARQQKELVYALSNMLREDSGKISAYLQGGANVESVYPPLWKKEYAGSWNDADWKMLDGYRKFYGYDLFCKKCEAMLMIYGKFNHAGYLLAGGEPEERIAEVFRAMDELGLALRFKIKGFAAMYGSLLYGKQWQSAVISVVGEAFGAHFEQLLSFCKEPDKKVRDVLVEILCGLKDRDDDLIKLLSSAAEEEREMAIRVLTRWEEEKYALVLRDALAREKSAKIRGLLTAVLPVDRLLHAEGVTALQGVVGELHKGNKKRTLEWAFGTPFSKVHHKDGREADLEYLQAVLLAYAAMAPKGEIVPYGVSATAEALAGQLDEKEYAVYVKELLDKWMAAGADSRKRWVLFAAANHGDADMADRLFQLIQEWADERTTLALEAVRALVLSRRPEALLLADTISRKFKVNKVKNAAGEALMSIASWLGLTREGLMDGTVPDLHFNEKMERVFDYGKRKFIAIITPALEVQLSDGNGRELKNLPKPGKADDGVKAAAAREEFKQLKKQVKTMAKSQGERLEIALSDGREWSIKAWKDLFLENPVMYQLAMGLIWGLYEKGKLVAAFRYMEDGIFSVEEVKGEQPAERAEFVKGEQPAERAEFVKGEQPAERAEFVKGEQPAERAEFMEEGQPIISGQSVRAEPVIKEVHTLEEICFSKEGCPTKEHVPANPKIALVHPVELSRESLNAWKEQLEDFEIVQPIPQLDRPVYRLKEEEVGQKCLERFEGIIVKEKDMKKNLQAFGWIYDWDEDIYYNKENQELSLGVQLSMEEHYEYDKRENAVMREAKFYVLTDNVDYANLECRSLEDVPERFFSEVVLEISQAMAGQGRV